MWLLMTALAAIIATAFWYFNAPEDKYKIGFLALMFWGATIMWTVDAAIASTEGEAFFEISKDATLLGVCTILFALFIWEVVLLINDPRGVLKKVLKK